MHPFHAAPRRFNLKIYHKGHACVRYGCVGVGECVRMCPYMRALILADAFPLFPTLLHLLHLKHCCYNDIVMNFN